MTEPQDGLEIVLYSECTINGGISFECAPDRPNELRVRIWDGRPGDGDGPAYEAVVYRPGSLVRALSANTTS